MKNKQEIPKLGTKEFNDLASAYFGGNPKQETLEDFIRIESKSMLESIGITKGAKWQQERMYSEEDIKYLEWIYERMINVHNENPNYDYMIIFKNILQQFKKKVNGKN